jgi:hypothetical protein
MSRTKKQETLKAVIRARDEETDFEMMSSDERFTRYEGEFVQLYEFDVEELVESEIRACWDSLSHVAREGYRKFGRGRLVIVPKMFSAALSADYMGETFENLPVEYVPERSGLFGSHDIPDYDPETEIVFLVDFYDGSVWGVAGVEEQMAEAA